MLTFAAISPHPPIIIPTIGQPSDLRVASRTIEGMKKLNEKFIAAKPETVLIISPHGPIDFYQFTVNEASPLLGHFYDFGDFQTELKFSNDKKLIEKIQKECKRSQIPLRIVSVQELDQGTLVPLYYLTNNFLNNHQKKLNKNQMSDVQVVPLAYSFLDIETHFQFGRVLGSVIKKEKTRIGIIASGDLSHRLIPDAPAGYSSRGKEFDKKLIELLENKDIEGVLNMDQELVEEAGECGYRSIIVLLGALSELGIGNWKFENLSYEGPFGVGYLVGNFKVTVIANERTE